MAKSVATLGKLGATLGKSVAYYIDSPPHGRRHFTIPNESWPFRVKPHSGLVPFISSIRRFLNQ
ncbi:hypothetical protein OAG60_00040 [bacterium]|nr:hypothetical protein [bacterium]